MSDRVNRLAVMGLGLMGGSLALAAKRRNAAASVRGWSRRAETRRAALERGVADRVFERAEEAVADADLVVFCTPVLSIPGLVEACAPRLAADSVVTDVGSTKGWLTERVAPLFAATRSVFVGSHPMAGSEEAGIEAARADLYEGATVVLTPPRGAPVRPADGPLREAMGRVDAFWRALGARVVRLSPAEHDAVVARTSHLPHLAAAALVSAVCREKDREVADFCGPGFRDTTRVAAGSAEIWRDILESNRDAVAAELEAYGAVVDDLRRMVAARDFDGLSRFLSESSLRRRAMGGRRSPDTGGGAG
ncbi:MAG: prephenate dehydrogenase/arogenate dehydrogenase family protein [Lentisphaerae bacterium]|nr:prephenate dehydrogenase/arogenate dehydrogenase family protein [Lentisphaerota bacterium]